MSKRIKNKNNLEKISNALKETTTDHFFPVSIHDDYGSATHGGKWLSDEEVITKSYTADVDELVRNDHPVYSLKANFRDSVRKVILKEIRNRSDEFEWDDSIAKVIWKLMGMMRQRTKSIPHLKNYPSDLVLCISENLMELAQKPFSSDWDYVYRHYIKIPDNIRTLLRIKLVKVLPSKSEIILYVFDKMYNELNINGETIKSTVCEITNNPNKYTFTFRWNGHLKIDEKAFIRIHDNQ